MKPLLRRLNNIKIGTKLVIFGVLNVVLTAVLLVGIGWWQSNLFGSQVNQQVEALSNAGLDHIVNGVYHLVEAQDASVQQKVNSDLNVARFVLDDYGDVTLSDELVNWTALNQYTKEPTDVQLPKMYVGDAWLGQNTNFESEAVVVDQVQAMAGGTTTIFQRINATGDMLRVATNVEKSDGTRAVGTYIPAINPDGSPNPVVSAVLRGETFRGRAYVVNAWYSTAYEPIFDDTGEVIGILYVGVKQENIDTLRQAIIDTKVGETGCVFVLGGTGNERGRYIISKNGERDGEDILNAQDADGNYFIQSIVDKAVALQPGEIAAERYPRQNDGETEARFKVAHIAYYEPWDWVIGVGAYEDEFQQI
jgi:hypothetical protein